MYRMMRAQEIKTSLDVSTLLMENKQLQLQLQQSDGIIAKLVSKISILEDKNSDHDNPCHAEKHCDLQSIR